MTVHIVGAGLSGLAAAVELTRLGIPVALHEAAAQAGGRCRSYHDKNLDRVIDNGNHLVLSGNEHVRRYLKLIGAEDRLVGPAGDGFRFLDLLRGSEFRLRPNRGALPWWVFSEKRRVPHTRALHYLGALKLAFAGSKSVGDVLPRNELYRVLWEPLAVSALNTAAEAASARGFWRVLAATLARGGAKSQPLIARHDLADTFVTPALAYLERHGAAFHTGRRVKGLKRDGQRATALEFDEGESVVAPGDCVIVAVPPTIAERLVPGLSASFEDEPIVNAHFATGDPEGTPLEIVAIVGGDAHWVFRRPGLASVTVSAARAMVDEAPESLAPRLWKDVARAFPALGEALPPYRIIKEKRATIRQTPADEARRPEPQTSLGNVWLAGDWTRTGLPATIEGSLLSGFRAAALARAAKS